MSVTEEPAQALYPFVLTEEQEQLRKAVREFAVREIAPNIMTWDEASTFPLAVIKQMGALGLLGILFPPEYGGAGLGYVDYALAIEELSAVDGSIGITMAAHNSLGSNHIFLAGNEAQRRKYIPRLASGEWLAAWGLTEPGSGSDASGARPIASVLALATFSLISAGFDAAFATAPASTERAASSACLSLSAWG